MPLRGGGGLEAAEKFRYTDDLGNLAVDEEYEEEYAYDDECDAEPRGGARPGLENGTPIILFI